MWDVVITTPGLVPERARSVCSTGIIFSLGVLQYVPLPAAMGTVVTVPSATRDNGARTHRDPAQVSAARRAGAFSGAEEAPPCHDTCVAYGTQAC